VGLAVFRRRVRPRWTYPARPAARRAQPLVASVYGIGKLLIDGMPAILRACHLPPNIQFAHDATFAGQWRRGRAMSKLSAILRHSGLPRVLSCWRRWGFAGGHFPLPRKTPVPRARSGSSCHFRRAARPMSWAADQPGAVQPARPASLCRQPPRRRLNACRQDCRQCRTGRGYTLLLGSAAMLAVGPALYRDAEYDPKSLCWSPWLPRCPMSWWRAPKRRSQALASSSLTPRRTARMSDDMLPTSLPNWKIKRPVARFLVAYNCLPMWMG